MSAVDIMLRQSTSVRADFNYGLAVAVSPNYVFKMKFRALGEARWILGILAVCWLVSLAFFPAISLVFAALLVFSLYFFRDPERQPPRDESLAVSPADGVVVEVKET